ncbi:MAG: HD domain-containing protein [Eubacteriales bacterium]|nr:HD domain-containing protein [Eubacteriales bacterium]
MREKIDEFEKYIQELPSLSIAHSDSVGNYVQTVVDRIVRSDICDLREKLPMPDKAYLIGRYHDIGKFGISNELWESPARFTEIEYRLAQAHTVIGAYIVRSRLSLSELSDETDIKNIIAESCLYHHERWDGTGYPFGLKGDQIPLYSRIVALADSYDAMIEQRPYKKSISKEEALAEIRAQKGKQFDPVPADIFCEIMSSL